MACQRLIPGARGRAAQRHRRAAPTMGAGDASRLLRDFVGERYVQVQEINDRRIYLQR